MSKLINLTPHDIKIIGTNNRLITIPKSGIIARIKTKNFNPQKINEEFKVYKQKVEQVIDLPEPSEDVIYIVSNVVLKALWKRTDLIAPNTTNGATKDERGNVIQVHSFIRN